MDSQQTRLTSINTQGLKRNIDYVSNLLNDNEILFICEHWLSNVEKHIIENSTHTLIFSSAEKQPAGRPYGGNCFMVHNTISKNIKVIHEDAHILAIQLRSLNLIVIGIYLTCYHDTSSKDDFSSQLDTITAIIEMYVEESEIVIVGDYQTFPARLYDNEVVRNNPKRN